MFLSMSGCDSQLLKLPFFVPAENTEDPRCWVDANGWHGAWGCPCPSSPGGELRPGHKAVFLWCPADILSTSHGQISLLIPYLSPSSTRHSLQVCGLSSCGRALLQPRWHLLPAKTVQVPAHVKTMFVVEGNSQRPGNKKKKNCIKQKGKRVRKKLLREGEGYSFKKGCREGDSEERLEELRMSVRQRDGRAMEISDLSTGRNNTIIDICISQPQKS